MPAKPHSKLQPFCHVDGCFSLRRTALMCQGHTRQSRAGEPIAVLRKQKLEWWDVPRCGFSDCANYSDRRGYCSGHYAQFRQGLGLTALRKHTWQKGGACAFDGCNLPMRANDLCNTHFSQQYAGKELHPIRGKIKCPVTDCEKTYTAKSSIEFCTAHVRILREYSLTPERLVELYADGSICAICKKQGKTVIDHDHACCTGTSASCGKCVRGILCINCNHAIGSARDSVAVLASAIDYLQSPPAYASGQAEQALAA